MDKYITFESNIDKILTSFEQEVDTANINVSRDTTTLVDSIIKGAIEKRASDIHIEPLDDKVRIAIV